MALLVTVVAVCLVSAAHTTTKRVCDVTADVCQEIEVDENSEALGQRLLRKQTEFYHLEQLSYSEDSAAQSIKIYNPNDETYDYYWFDTHRNEGIYKGRLRGKGMTATNSYRGHVFYFTRRGKPDEEVHRISVLKNINDYIIPPTEQAKNDGFYIKLKEKQTFYEEYFQKTGTPWLSSYNRPSPVLFMYNRGKTDPIGTIYQIVTPHGFWHCIPDASLDKAQQKEQCQDSNELRVDIEVISVEPKMFVIENIISDTEAELVKQLATPKLHRSGTGQAADANHADETRTSQTAWIPYREHAIIDTIFRRTANILQIDEKVLQRNAEHLQTVYYAEGQEYKAHHDFSDNGRDSASRYITILFYLSDQADEHSGGETWFPKARHGKGIKVHPGKGNAVLFYDLLEDGNGDDLTLHEAVRVERGSKWICNFWVWDPKKPFK